MPTLHELSNGARYQVTAIDQDEQALAAATRQLSEYGDRIQFILSNFAD